MTESKESTSESFLARMVKHNVAANLLMVIILVGGLIALLRTKQEVFPEFSLDTVTVAVPYRGASPAEVEQGIVLAIEEAVRSVDGVKRVNSVSAEGQGVVTVELLIHANREQVLADVKNEVDRIRTFPQDAEEPTVSLSKRRRQVVSLVIAGDQSLHLLHELAEDARRRLLEDPRVSQAELEGIAPLEIAIEVPRENLEKYGLTLPQVAAQVRMASQELPGGGLETRKGEILLRVADRLRTGQELQNLIVRSSSSGAEIRLGEIARIYDGFEDTNQESYYNGHRAVRLTVYRVGDERPTDVSDAARDLAMQLEQELPDDIEVAIWNDDSELLRDRIDLLLSNAKAGLALVLICLALFLDLRLAFWVATGIPISFLGAFFILGPMDISINMITLFAFIVTLGMVVDDAIIVGERTYALMEEGKSRLDAAVQAAREMIVPVSFAILTSISAFAPMLFVPGVMGKIFRMIPLVVMTVLAISLVESFLILPAHLGHGRSRRIPRVGILGWIVRGHGKIGVGLEWVTRRVYRPCALLAVRLRYVTLASSLAMLMILIAWVGSGRLPFNFFPDVEGDIVSVQARLPYGVAIEETKKVQKVLEAGVNQAIKALGRRDQIRGMYSRLGQAGQQRGPGAGAPEIGSHLVSIEVNLVPVSQRQYTAGEFSAAWQDSIPEMAGVESLVFSSGSGPTAGAAVALQLSHNDHNVLAAASQATDSILRSYPDLRNIRNEYSDGKTRLDFHLKPEARALDLTGEELAQQLRSAFFGAEAIRDQRDRNEIRVMARLPESERSSENDIDRLMIRTPRGGTIPLGYVATHERELSPTAIRREDGRRNVSVTAELAVGVPSPQEVLADLKDNVMPDLKQRYPGLRIGFVGAQREQQEAFKALGVNFLFAIFVIFALLAIPFRSYVQPLIVMAAIPFSIGGAIVGHMVMGYGLSIMSAFGVVALAGVVVNDSLVLVDAINHQRRAGKNVVDAVLKGGMSRMRAIMLTSVTTFLGLAPMIAETSVQARFLIPMAISLGFGVMFTTFVTLILVPALYVIVEDAVTLFRFQDSHPAPLTQPGQPAQTSQLSQ